MKRISKILSLVLIWILCSADGCNDDVSMADVRVEKQISAAKDSIRQLFEVAKPADQILRAYEETAKQKLIDFSDYMRISSDSSLDVAFRIQATKMAGRLFISEKSDISGWGITYPESGMKTLDSLINLTLSKANPIWIKPVQVNVLSALSLKNDTTYEGKLSFYQQSFSFEKQNSMGEINEQFAIEIYAVKRIKTFGTKAFSVWEVCLGDLETLQRK